MFYGHAISRYNGTTGSYMGDFVPSGSGGLTWDADIVFGPDGNLYETERYAHSVKRYNGTTGAYMGDFVASGSGGLGEVSGLLWFPPAGCGCSGSPGPPGPTGPQGPPGAH